MAPKSQRISKRSAAAELAGYGEVWRGIIQDHKRPGAARAAPDSAALKPALLRRIGHMAALRGNLRAASAVAVSRVWDGVATDSAAIAALSAAIGGRLSVTALARVARPFDAAGKRGTKAMPGAQIPSRSVKFVYGARTGLLGDVGRYSWARAIPVPTRIDEGGGFSAPSRFGKPAGEKLTGRGLKTELSQMSGVNRSASVAATLALSEVDASAAEPGLSVGPGTYGSGNVVGHAAANDPHPGGEHLARWLLGRLTRDAGRPDAGASFFNARQSPAWSGVTIGL